MSSNLYTYNSVGSCCRTARPFFSSKITPFTIAVDFLHNKKRQGYSILEYKVLLRDGRTYRPVEHWDNLELEGHVVKVDLFPPPGVYVLSVRLTLDNPLRTLVTQDISIKVPSS